MVLFRESQAQGFMSRPGRTIHIERKTESSNLTFLLEKNPHFTLVHLVYASFRTFEQNVITKTTGVLFTVRVISKFTANCRGLCIFRRPQYLK